MFLPRKFSKRHVTPLLAVIMLSVASCKFSNSPESVAQKFLISFNQLDFATAKSLSTPETWGMLDIMATATKNVSENQKQQFAEHFSVKIMKVEKESDSSVIVTFQTHPKRLPFDRFRMKKTLNQNGDVRWKVDISTLDLLNSKKMLKDSLPGMGTPEEDSLGITPEDTAK